VTTLAGRAVLVTGANRGMGREYVRQLLDRGVTTVYAAARDPHSVDVIDPRGVALALDVTDAASVAAAAKAKGIVLQLPAQAPNVWGNKVRLREAFYNLVSNAIKFMDKPRGEITIHVEPREKSVLFIIADNGPGIPHEELESIFVPFRRLPGHRHLPGSGLGLYFTKQLIGSEGGRICAESTLGEGSQFFVQLPTPRTAPG